MKPDQIKAAVERVDEARRGLREAEKALCVAKSEIDKKRAELKNASIAYGELICQNPPDLYDEKRDGPVEKDIFQL